MNRRPLENYCKGAVIVIGLACVAVALFSAPYHAVGWSYAAILVFAAFIAPRLSLTLPRSNLIISFSDAIIFLTFVLYGGEIAILTAFVEMIANCLYLKKRGLDSASWFVVFNSSLAA